MAPRRSSSGPRQPFLLWLTGLPAAGKSTLAERIAERLRDSGLAVCVLDGDAMRRGLNADLGFSDAGRDENVRRAAEVAKLLLDGGIIVVAALISPFREARGRARDIAGAERFIEIFVDAPLEVCQARDPKGLYAKAAVGEISALTGIDSPYETPQAPQLHLRSDRETPQALANEVMRCLGKQGRL